MRKTCLNMVHELARADKRIVFVGSDLGAGTLDAMREELPDQFFMEGIAEQNLIGVAAGLALEGYIPYVNTIATFLTRRCLEQIAIDLCLHKLPVRLIGNGGGLVYAPLGPTHTTLEDVALMSALPNMGVCAVTDAEEMRRMMPQTVDWTGPLYIRLAKGGDPVVSSSEDDFQLGSALERRRGGDVLILAYGVMVERALQVAEMLEQSHNLSATVLNVHTIKPLDSASILNHARGKRLVIAMEEHGPHGGLSAAVALLLAQSDMLGGVEAPRFRAFAAPDAYAEGYGSQNQQIARMELDAESITQRIRTML
ncbi:transketolase family protein [Magnetofaba australis]|uniref:Putative transketolase subunit B n=1 Tax=Magnetofaba australis IT-1 TaxID=1434232 RepID=A0A1Y2K5D2_9PROT|nr:transketolase C-terminal domain-containing protein [Magnetofaba australis]OSM04214.1 putative transketolase subunit B [Magnetofaba australis IT-1]